MAHVRTDLWDAVEVWIGGLSRAGGKAKYLGPFYEYEKTGIKDLAAQLRAFAARYEHVWAAGLGVLPGDIQGRRFLLLNLSEDANFYAQVPDSYIVLKASLHIDNVVQELERLFRMMRTGTLPPKPEKSGFWAAEPPDAPMMNEATLFYSWITHE